MRRISIMTCLIGIIGFFGLAFGQDLGTAPAPPGSESSLAGAPGGEMDATAAFRARVEKTGQTISYGVRDDGRLRKGVAWPNPRFTDNGDGTVTDNLTGLIWLKDPGCNVCYAGDTPDRSWAAAMKCANRLQNGYCGLSDSSIPGDWRLPNRKELASLIDYGFYDRALSNTAGTGQWTPGDPFSVVGGAYWSSTTWSEAWGGSWAFVVEFREGQSGPNPKSDPRGRWPVRGPNKGAFPARVEKTGQTTSYFARDDGRLRKGVAWPNPRFTDNGDGTVRDNLTGLIWLKDSGCTTFFEGDPREYNSRRWLAALVSANRLKDGYCGLTDGSAPYDWRLPNVKELESLVDFEFDVPDTAGTGKWSEGDPFLHVIQKDRYWSSTTAAHSTDEAWYGPIPDHDRGLRKQKGNLRVWPVRGPR